MNNFNLNLYSKEFHEILNDNLEYVGFESGIWREHEGDAFLYAPLLFLTYGKSTKDERIVQAGIRTITQISKVINQSRWNIPAFLIRLNDIVCGSSAIIMAQNELLERVEKINIEKVKGAMSRLRFILKLINYDLSRMSFIHPIRFYGSTTISANIASLFLLYSQLLQSQTRKSYYNVAESIKNVLDKEAWDDALGAYRISKDRGGLYLYPNVTMIILLVNFFKITGNNRFLEKSKKLFLRIGELRSDRGFYYSPYSAEHNGAKTKDYATLSSQNYLLIALYMLYNVENDPIYRDEASKIFKFIFSHLFSDGKLLHHWIDGRIADKNLDREFYCRGCNLQFLYVHHLWNTIDK